MPVPMALLPLILAQTGPLVGDGPAPSLNLPQIDRPSGPNRRHQGPTSGDTALPRPAASRRLTNCLARAAGDPDSAVETANAWVREASGADLASAQQCRGTALANLGAWDDAQTAFLAGRAAAPEDAHVLRATLGAMAGSAALAGGGPAQALSALDDAAAEAKTAGQGQLEGGIEVDRAKALVALRREADAASALRAARTLDPANAEAWLLSATLSRRMNFLTEAQDQIEAAARLAPTDPDVGTEAGVIAALSGHYEAARKSWQSVIATAPDSEAATRARANLAQLDAIRPAASPPPPPAAPAAPANAHP